MVPELDLFSVILLIIMFNISVLGIILMFYYGMQQYKYMSKVANIKPEIIKNIHSIGNEILKASSEYIITKEQIQILIYKVPDSELQCEELISSRRSLINKLIFSGIMVVSGMVGIVIIAIVISFKQ